MSAFASLRGLVISQVRSRRVANEVAGAQDLLQDLDLRRAVVTLDAAHTVTATLRNSADRGGATPYLTTTVGAMGASLITTHRAVCWASWAEVGVAHAASCVARSTPNPAHVATQRGGSRREAVGTPRRNNDRTATAAA